MTSTLLKATGTVRLNQSGSGVITLRPDMGQYWSPLFVRVATNTNSFPVAYCAVYHGAPGVPPQPSQFLDDTFNGNGDSSSIIAGTPIVPGEAVLFQFLNGTANDIATATVYGMTSDTPPNLDLTPQVPGARFSGHPTTETDVALITTATAFTLAGGGSSFSGSVNPIDVRNFASYYLAVSSLTVDPATGINPIKLDLTWFSDAAGNNQVYHEFVEFWADNTTGTLFSGGPMMIDDIMHGPYMTIKLSNNATADHVVSSWSLTGTTRVISSPFFRQEDGVDGVLSPVNTANVNIANGATVNVPMSFAYGHVYLKLASSAANGVSASLFYAGLTQSYAAYNLPSVTAFSDIVVPKRSMMWQVGNSSGAAQTFSIVPIMDLVRS